MIETFVFTAIIFLLCIAWGVLGFFIGFYSCRANMEKFWNEKLKK